MAKRTAKQSNNLTVQVYQPCAASFVDVCNATFLNIVVDGSTYNVTKGDTPGSLRVILSTTNSPRGGLAVRPRSNNSVELAIT